MTKAFKVKDPTANMLWTTENDIAILSNRRHVVYAKTPSKSELSDCYSLADDRTRLKHWHQAAPPEVKPEWRRRRGPETVNEGTERKVSTVNNWTNTNRWIISEPPYQGSRLDPESNSWRSRWRIRIWSCRNQAGRSWERRPGRSKAISTSSYLRTENSGLDSTKEVRIFHYLFFVFLCCISWWNLWIVRIGFRFDWLWFPMRKSLSMALISCSWC